MAAYYLDKAVRTFGQAVEQDLEAATSQGKRKKALSDSEKVRKRREVIERWLNIKIERQYRDPVKG